MTNDPFDSLDELRDVDTLNPLRNAIEAGEVASFETVKEGIRANSRDNARTPMQWTDGTHAGFTDGEPWIGVNPNHDAINVERERATDNSVWRYYRDLVALREEHDVVVYGDYEPLFPDDDEVWAYTRTLDGDDGTERLVVALNFSGDDTDIRLPDGVATEGGSYLLGNYDVDEAAAAQALAAGDLRLRPWEARVYRVVE
jgi:oligo-1,6-glucosidase